MLSVMCDVDCGMLSVGRAVRDVVLLGVCVIGCFECGLVLGTMCVMLDGPSCDVVLLDMCC